MSDQNKEYNESLNSYRDEQIDYFVNDVFVELNDIERTLESENSKILMSWIKSTILRLQDEYKEHD